MVAAERGESISDMVREWAKALYGPTPVKASKVASPVESSPKTSPSAVPAPKKAAVEDKQTEGLVNVIRGGTCSKCGATGVKTATNREMKEVCYKCAEVKS